MQEDLYYPHSTVQDLLWDGLHYLSEPILKYWPFTKLRERGLKRAVELMRYGAEESRYMTIGCVEKVSLSGFQFIHQLFFVQTYKWVNYVLSQTVQMGKVKRPSLKKERVKRDRRWL